MALRSARRVSLHRRGFDEYLEYPSRRTWESFWGVESPRGVFQPTPLPLLNATAGAIARVVEQPVGLHTLVDKYVGFASDFVARSASTSKPFYLYFPFNHIHAPNSCNASFCGATARGPVGDAVAEVDWAVGQMMAALARAASPTTRSRS